MTIVYFLKEKHFDQKNQQNLSSLFNVLVTFLLTYKKVVSWKCDIKRSKKKDNSIKMWLSPGLSNRKTVVL
ncbi:hypothetical protein [Wolbachia endosymbiont (group A) of Andrena hattorfiana]|uniref:hypothetical protein n=1 Tax=Wolbachia endosymbiont (group A) of Andrena hattorfiana TaxID=2953977 RepID=UPI0021F848C7|nr:hypothetical protein [Wolbachia endosymbiont (group A) of Andrena hattorfiana]